MSVEMRTREEVAASIGQRVRSARLALGWSQERLAREMGMSRETVRKIEAGVTLPEIPTLEVLALALATTPTALLDWPSGLWLNHLGTLLPSTAA